MADRKISDLTALTTPASGDFLPIVDISEAAAASKNKRITIEELMRGVPDGTAAAPGIAFETYPSTGVYSSGANQLAVATNGVERVEFGTAEVVFNDCVENYDFRIESDNEANLFFVDAAFDRVGVGTSAPGAILDVNGTVRMRIAGGGDGRYVDIGSDGSGTTRFFNNYAGGGDFGFTWKIGASDRMTLDSSGRLGIGTSASSHRLHVVGGNGAGNTTIGCYGGSSAGDYGLLILGTGSTDKASINVDATTNDLRLDLRGNTGAFTFVSGPSYTERMRLDSSGRVGIGTPTPAYVLDLNNASASTTIGLRQGGTLYGYVEAGSSQVKLGSNAAIPINFEINGTEAARFDSSRRLLVGTSTDTTARLVVKGSAGGGDDGINVISGSTTLGSKAAIFFSPSTSGSFSTGSAIKTERLSPDGSDLQFYTCTALGSSQTERMRIDNLGRIFTYNANTGNNSLTVASAAAAGTAVATFIGVYSATGVNTGTSSFIVWTNGNVQNTNNSYTAISDIKLKENIVDANSQWDDLKALRVRNYNLKEGQTHTQIGLVAQEVEPISPGLVYESPDRDEEGTDLGTVTKSVNYSVLYMKAVKALQEAMKRIEQLEVEMAEVKAQLS